MRGYSLPLRYEADRRIGIRADGSFADAGPLRRETQAGGRFDVEVALKGKVGRTAAAGTLIPFETPEGDILSGQFLLRGKLGSRLASGSYRAFGTVRGPDGSKLSCDSGAVRWTARRG